MEKSLVRSNSTEQSALINRNLQNIIEWFENDIMRYKASCKVPLFKVTGVTLSVLGSAYVGIQSFHFGETYINFACGIALGILSTLPIMALSGKQFLSLAEELARFKSVFEKNLDGRSCCNRSLAKYLGVISAIIPGIIASLTLTYVNYTQFEPYSVPLAHVLDVAVFLSKSLVYTWSIYNLGNIIKSAINRCYLNSEIKKERLNADIMRLKLIKALDKSKGKFKSLKDQAINDYLTKLQMTNDIEATGDANALAILSEIIGAIEPDKPESTPYLKYIIQGLGGVIGIAASYALLPTGINAGKFFANLINLDPYSTEILSQFIGWTSIIPVGALMCHTTSVTFENVYDFFTGFCKTKDERNDDDSADVPSKCSQLSKALRIFLFIGLAAASTVPRIELTLVESELSFAINMVIISTVFIAGFCKDYWGISGFYDEVTSKVNKKTEVNKLLSYVQERISLMSAEHIESLYDHIYTEQISKQSSDSQQIPKKEEKKIENKITRSLPVTIYGQSARKNSVENNNNYSVSPQSGEFPCK